MTSEQPGVVRSTKGVLRGPELGVTLSERAAREVVRLLAAQKRDPHEYGLRIRIVPGGCPTLLHALALDRLREGDESFEHEGVRVIIDRRSLTLLHGTIVDHERTDTSEGFRIQNPNPLNRSCRCGTPFTL